MNVRKKSIFLSDWKWGLLLALLCTVLINLPLLHGILFNHELSYPDIFMKSGDEIYYLARIREVADGYPFVGHPYVFEQRESLANLGSMADNIAALPMTLLGMSIKEASIFGDLFFPFLLAFLLWIALIPILPERTWRTLLVATLFLGSNMAFWERPVSPQVITIVYFLYLWSFFHPHRSAQKLCIARSILVALSLYTYPYHFLVIASSEGLLLLNDVWKSIKQNVLPWNLLLHRILPTVLPALLFSLPILFVTHVSSKDPAYAETLFRLGLISHHFPKGPELQLGLFLTILIGWFIAMKQNKQKEFFPLLLLLLSGLIALSSPIITGKEVEFSSHFERFLPWSIWTVVFFCLSILLKKKHSLHTPIIVLISTALILQTTISVKENMATFEPKPSEERTAFADVITLFKTLPPESVILTEPPMSEFVPIYSSHYPFFSRFTRLHVVPEEELLHRAKMLSTLVPNLPPHSDRTLFGTGHLNRTLHKKTICKMKSFLKRELQQHCEVDPLQFIPPSWIEIFEQPAPSIEEALQALRKSHTRYALFRETPSGLLPYLEYREKVGKWTLYEIAQ